MPRNLLNRRPTAAAASGYLRSTLLLCLLVVACGDSGSSDSSDSSNYSNYSDGSELSELPPASGESAPVVVIGIDGAEWKVIRRLWEEGELPNLRRLSEEGTSATLATAYGASPVIWTTIATGRPPEVHGITDFVVTTEKGTVPISSAVRRVPALWNVASRAGLRAGVFGWWASWPAEAIRGVVISDRAHLGNDRVVHPEAYLESFEREREAAREGYPGFGGRLASPDIWMEDGAFRDRIMAHEAQRFIPLGFDLLLVYFRGVDIASHRYWKYLEPEHYAKIDDAELAASAHVVPTVYQATDEAIGRIVAAAPADSNIFVLSDHGFMAGREEHFVNLSAERMLERFGFLVRENGAVDFARSIAYPVDSPNHAVTKKIRLSLAGREPDGRVAPGEADAELTRLTKLLEDVTYEGGGRVFRVRRDELPEGIDLLIDVSLEDPTMRVRVGDETWDDVVLYINRISGTHNASTDGIFIARGPDLVPGAVAEGISILDMAPTLLYAAGLPVALDFPGRARTELFSQEFLSAHPLETVPSWGTMDSWKVEASPEDEQLIEELRALGYL